MKRCPFRDKISVEKAEQLALRRPLGDGIWIEKYCVPNGTPWRMCASIFYRYYIPIGMRAQRGGWDVKNIEIRGVGGARFSIKGAFENKGFGNHFLNEFLKNLPQIFYSPRGLFCLFYR